MPLAVVDVPLAAAVLVVLLVGSLFQRVVLSIWDVVYVIDGGKR